MPVSTEILKSFIEKLCLHPATLHTNTMSSKWRPLHCYQELILLMEFLASISEF